MEIIDSNNDYIDNDNDNNNDLNDSNNDYNDNDNNNDLNDNNNDLNDNNNDLNDNNNDLSDNDLNDNNNDLNDNKNDPNVTRNNNIEILNNNFSLNYDFVPNQLLYTQNSTQQTQIQTEFEDSIAVKAFNMLITIQDLNNINSANNLSNKIIDFYLNMIIRKEINKKLALNINLLNSNDFKNFTDNQIINNHSNIFDYDFTFIPLFLFDHWSLILIRQKEQKVNYYDSKNNSKTILKRKKETKKYVIELISQDALIKKRLIDFKNWSIRAANSVPQIQEDHDSGAFICLVAKTLSYNVKLNPNKFTNEYIINFKNNLINEIKIVDLSIDDDLTALSETNI
jgi:hypothetical protein